MAKDFSYAEEEQVRTAQIMIREQTGKPQTTKH